MNTNDMIDSLKTYIKNKETDKILGLIGETPEILDLQDESGTSGLLLIAYAGMPEVLKGVMTLKKNFTFHEAVVCDLLEQAQDMLAHNPKLINQHANDGFTPVSLAVFFDRSEMAKWLLDQGADPNLQATNPSKVNALHAAVAKNNTELCKLLIAKGADVNALQMQRITPLHSAAHRGNLEMVTLLVKHGADIHLKMENGDTALSIAKRDGHKEVAAYLEEG